MELTLAMIDAELSAVTTIPKDRALELLLPLLNSNISMSTYYQYKVRILSKSNQLNKFDVYSHFVSNNGKWELANIKDNNEPRT